MSLLHEYRLKDGLAVCGRFLADNWTNERLHLDEIFVMYEWAINFQMEELQSFCERKITRNAEKLFKTNGFRSCSFGMLDRILKWDALLCYESVVLDACLDWARHKCQQSGKESSDIKNLREYLIDSAGSNLLWNVRYGSIEHGKYSTVLNADSGLFDDDAELGDVKIRHLKNDKLH